MLTYQRLRELLSYDPATGQFVWLVARGRQGAGSCAGRQHPRFQYWDISIDGRRYKSHRLAWLYMAGDWPAAELDHINGDRTDNRWVNLREATRAQNCWNQPVKAASWTQRKGVSPHRMGWQARIWWDGKRRYLGVFSCPEMAGFVYSEHADVYHKEFARA